MRLRWELSKVWQKPISDPIFNEISPMQWLIYASLIGQDRKEEVEQWRDRLEYMARFIDNNAVEKVRAARERTETQKSSETDEAFEQVLQRNFGTGRGLLEKLEKTKAPMPIQELGQQIKKATEIDEIRIVGDKK